MPISSETPSATLTGGEIHIDGYTIAEISNDSALLGRYRDPFGYFRECVPPWLEVLRSSPGSSDGDLAIILAVDGETVVGRLGMFAASACVNGEKTETFWLTLFLVHEDYRRTGAGALMLLRAVSYLKCLVAAGGIPPEVQELYKSAGFKDLGRLQRYVYFFTTSPILMKFLRIGPLSIFLSYLTNPLLSLYYATRSRSCQSQVTFEAVARFDFELDEILEGRNGDYFPRGVDYINWVLQSCDNLQGFRVVRQGKLIGYILLRVTDEPAQTSGRWLPAIRLGCLLDYYLQDGTPADKRAIIEFCIPFFRAAGADVFECQSNDDDLVSACSRLGMIQMGGNRVLFRPPQGTTIPDVDSWSLTQGEGDVILASVGAFAPPESSTRTKH